jgi:hypothetical protein
MIRGFVEAIECKDVAEEGRPDGVEGCALRKEERVDGRFCER